MCFYHPTYAERNWPEDVPEPTEAEIADVLRLVKTLPKPTDEEIAELRRIGVISR